MSRLVVLISIALASAFASSAGALTANDLVGTWTLAASGTFGPNAKGILMFDANGHVSAILMRADLPKYASNNRYQGTADEHKATAQGMLAWFGTYTLKGTDLMLHIEGSSFPNWNGDQKRTNLTISGDELKWTQPAPSVGGAPFAVVWKRAK